MIDKIKVYKDIILDVNNFSSKFKRLEKLIDVNKWTGEVYNPPKQIDFFIYKNNGITIIYNNQRSKLSVIGRLPNISSTKNLVYNLDDYLLGHEKLIKYNIWQEERSVTYLCDNATYDSDDKLVFPDQWEHFDEPIFAYDDLESIIRTVNDKLFELTKEKFDITTFNISYIEVCFNLFNVPQVGKYIELFNLIYAKNNPKSYVNYVLLKDLGLHTSFYVKSKTNYRLNTNSSYTVNFYNKLDQLEYLEKHPKNNINVTSYDKELAKGVLRLEIKVGYQQIDKDSTFIDYLNMDFCSAIVRDKYTWFIDKNTTTSFYSYQSAKSIIEETTLLKPNDKKNLLNHIRDKAQYNKSFSKQTQTKYNNMLACLGIHWFFIPTKWGINYLESPMLLLDKKIKNISQFKDEYEY